MNDTDKHISITGVSHSDLVSVIDLGIKSNTIAA